MATATTYSTNIKTNDISSIIGDLVASSQTSFTFAPHCSVLPSTAEDLCNKDYVDTRLVNSGSGVNLYFNQTVVQVAPYKQLSTSIIVTVPPTTQTVVINHPAGGTNTLIQSFITDSGFPGTVTIPSGIYVLNQFGNTNVGGTVGILEYFFILSKRPLVGVDVVLGTSGVSADVNTSVTDIFFAQLSLGAQTLLATDRLIIDIYAKGTGATNPTNTLTSSFEGNTYSYITTPLVSGSNFLSLDNTFTGSNSFTQLVTMSGTMPVVTTTSNSSAPSITFVSACIADRLIPYLTTALGVTLAGTQTIAGDKTFTPNVTLNGTMPLATTTTSTTAPSITFVSDCIANRLIPYLTTALGVTLAGIQTIAGAKTFTPNVTLNGTMPAATTTTSTTAPSITFVSACIADRLLPYLTTALGVALAGAQSITGLKSFTSPIGLGSIPTVSSQLGFISSSAISAVTLTGTLQTLSTIASLPIGTYVISATVIFQFTNSAAAQLEINIKKGATVIATNSQIPLGAYVTSSTSNTTTLNCTGIYENTAISSIIINGSASYALGTSIASSGGNFKAIRIG